jgi:hypothetical protein
MNRRSFIQTLVGAAAGTTVAALPAPAPAGRKLTLAEEQEAWFAQIEEDNREAADIEVLPRSGRPCNPLVLSGPGAGRLPRCHNPLT